MAINRTAPAAEKNRSAIVGDEARLDIKARGFEPNTGCILDVSVDAPCYRSKDTATIHTKNEATKKRV